ncbi:alpha/beta hydrolase family protein [Acinetobacter sp. GN11]
MAKVLNVQYGENPLQFGELFLPEGTGPFPVVILIHGGFWKTVATLTDLHSLSRYLVKAGFAVWNIEYRRVGDVGGGWPGTFEDIASAADYVNTLAEKYPINANAVVSVGHSAGGHLALWLGARHKLPKTSILFKSSPLGLKAAISLAGISDLRMAWDLKLGKGIVSTVSAVSDFLGGNPEEIPVIYAESSPSELLPLKTPQVLIHGALDDVVPIGMSEEYLTKAREVGDQIKLIRLEDEDHMQLVSSTSSAWDILATEIHHIQSL